MFLIWKVIICIENIIMNDLVDLVGMYIDIKSSGCYDFWELLWK